MESSKRLRFVTWNIGGKINIPDIKTLPKTVNIVFLQETRIGPKNNNFDNLQGWKVFFTVYDSRTAGVAILIKHGVQFDYICHDEDSSGDYLVLFCRLCGELFTLVNVYNHKDDKKVLKRLQDYLRETAEGVLVVGGDFNVVLDIVIDRKSKNNDDKQTAEWKTFKKFTSSLNLMDAWAYCKPTSVGFTYKSQSRLDMFLLSEDNLDRITNIHVDSHELGHSPLSMTLKIKENSSNEVPAVASYLKKHGVNVEPDRRAGKINGAEILSVIKSLADSGHKRPDSISVQTYKKDCCPFTECLKIDFNRLMKNKEFPKDFNSCFTTSESDGRQTYHHFNVKYLIFTMILAKRLKLLLNESSEKEGNKEGNAEQQKEGNKEGNPEQQKEGNKEGNPEQQKKGNKSKAEKTDDNNNFYLLTFTSKQQKIEWTFLKTFLNSLFQNCLIKIAKQKKHKKIKQMNEQSLLKDCNHGAVVLTQDIRVLEIILPKVNSESTLEVNSSSDLRVLRDGCPLTRFILSLVLKYLELEINANEGYTAHVCHFRKCLVIQKDSQSSLGGLRSLRKRFQRDSGIELELYQSP